MEQYSQPMDIGTIFERTIDLIGKTFVRNITVAVIFLFLPVILMTVAANDFYSEFSSFQEEGIAGGEQGLDALIPFITRFVFFMISTLLFTVGSLLSEMAIIQIVAGEINGNPISYPSAIARTFDQRWLRGIGEELLKIFAVVFGGVFLAIIVAIAGSAFGSSSSEEGGGSSVLLILLVFGTVIPAMFYMFIALYFALVSISINGSGIMESFGESWQLVRGHWWRTFGILLLMMIITQFIATIISAPFTFGSMWDVYTQFFTRLKESKGNIDPDAFQKIQGSYGLGIGIGSGIGALIRLMISPVYSSVMYYDLIARFRSAQPVQEPTASELPAQEP